MGWDEIKRAVLERARRGSSTPRCEYSIGGLRCGREATTVDHFFGGHGRRLAEQSVETCWALCATHDLLRTLNKPTRFFWLGIFAEHVVGHHYAGRVIELIDADVARIEGKCRVDAA